MSPSFYTVENETEQEAVVYALVHNPENPSSLSPADQIGTYFYDTTRKLIENNSFGMVGGKVRGVDIVRHVLKVVPVAWAATEVVRYIHRASFPILTLFRLESN